VVVWELDVRATLPAFLRLLPVVAGVAGEVIILKIAILLFKLAAESESFPFTGAATELRLLARNANRKRNRIFANFFIVDTISFSKVK
jgi:hypothetical protein